MKTLITTALQLAAFLIVMVWLSPSAIAAEKFTKIADTTITLTDLPCTMTESPPDIIMFQAYAKDLALNQEAQGCYFKTADGKVVITLANTTSKGRYGYVLPQAIFKNREYF